MVTACEGCLVGYVSAECDSNEMPGAVLAPFWVDEFGESQPVVGALHWSWLFWLIAA